MKKSLFRKEALKSKTTHFGSNTTLVVPPSFTVFSSFAFLVAASLVTLLFLGRYSPKDTVRGYVTTTFGGVEVYSHSDGTILELLVSEGDAVAKNQEILRLSTARAVGQSTAIRSRILTALRSEQSALREQGLREAEAAKIQQQMTEEEVSALKVRLKQLQEQRTDLAAGLRLSERALQRLATLDAGDFVAQKDLDQATAAKVEFKLRLRDVKLLADATQAEVRQKQLKLLEIPVLRDRRAAEMRAKTHQLTVKITESLGRDTQSVLAPSTGIVSGLLVRGGQTISASRPLLNIIPEDVEFYVEILVPTRTIGFVRSDGLVNIRFDAFPYQKFGTHKGVIESVSRTTVLPSDKRFRIPITAPMYVARVRLDNQGVLAYGELQTLQSGMTLTADVLRDERRLIEWIFDPLIGATRKL